METDGLFSLAPPDARTAEPAGPTAAGFGRPAGDAPLPVRMRPTSLDELIGQKHLLAPGAPLRQLVTGTSPMSVILWGPPGTGKTTIAHLVANATDRKFVAMSALTAGVKDVRAVIDTARRERRYGGPPTVLFIDEVHRFSKTQQDSLLAAVEDRTVTLLAATTENPYFSVISPLLSRCVLLTLQPLAEDDVRRLIRRAVSDERGLGGTVALAPDAEDHLVRLASGDVRKALTALEAAAGSALAQDAGEIDLATAEKAVDVAAVRYDRDGDAHYDVISAFIKSMRGSDPDAALHYLARMLVAGEDPRFIARRIVIFASEDVGMADPQALLVATAAAQAVQNVGLPEAGLNLAQAVVHAATAPKSNSVTTALGEAMADVRAGRGGPVPPHLRDAHYSGSRGLGHGRGYRYPHDDPRGVVRQQYVPDDLVGTDYYRPTDHGAERAVGERVPRLRRIVRGLSPTSRPVGGGPAAGSGAAGGETNPGTASRPVTASVGASDRAAGGAPAANASQSSADSEPVGTSAVPQSKEMDSDGVRPAGRDTTGAATPVNGEDGADAAGLTDGTGGASGAGPDRAVTSAEAGGGAGVTGRGPAAGGAEGSDDSGDSAGKEQR
ncbi:replication-associated recombination protein A [Actinoplanes sp. NEAU-A12]|uniref:Replication-associated recombination protein A n=1 Tax=Actinoplanes sandaracinus TaxID=3045177 RepID=A0ABT6WV77_9ACTN|nr:replication-associated recombination protein A [Actinoplanes sandaracinus]MDI6103618.1 replication-associated recombination protein A [Actinoplanes sandaracinus]